MMMKANTTRARALAAGALLAGLVAVAGPAGAQEETHAAGGHEAAAEGHGGGHSETGEGHHQVGVDGKTLAFQVLNFGALLFVLIKFGGGAVSKTLLARHQQLKVAIEEAAKLRADALARLQEQDKRLSNLEAELGEMRAAMKRESEGERARLIATAEERATRIGEETRFLLDQQVKQAELRFKGEVAEAALKVAEEVLRKSVDMQDEQRLARAFVTNVASDGNGAGVAGHGAGDAPRAPTTGPGSLVQ